MEGRHSRVTTPFLSLHVPWRQGAHEMILEMVAWRDPNVIAVKAFYGDDLKVRRKHPPVSICRTALSILRYSPYAAQLARLRCATRTCNPSSGLSPSGYRF